MRSQTIDTRELPLVCLSLLSFILFLSFCLIPFFSDSSAVVSCNPHARNLFGGESRYICSDPKCPSYNNKIQGTVCAFLLCLQGSKLLLFIFFSRLLVTIITATCTIEYMLMAICDDNRSECHNIAHCAEICQNDRTQLSRFLFRFQIFQPNFQCFQPGVVMKKHKKLEKL